MKVHYFQRYEGRENVETSNFLLLLSRFYHYNSEKFFNFINDLMPTTLGIEELSFDLQPKGKGSVPDASISQKSFKIVVETKLYNQFCPDQLIRHVHSFSNEDIKILLTLDPMRMKSNLLNTFNEELAKINVNVVGNKVIHINTTFKEVIEKIEEHLDSRDYEMLDILNDYKEYCINGKLFNDAENWMRGITVRTTYDSNIRNNLYYDGYDRGFSAHSYIGLYKDKAIRAIGKITKKVIGYTDDNGVYQMYDEDNPKTPITDSERANIANAIKDSKEYYGFALDRYKHRFFLVDKFYEIDYKKTIGGPIQRAKFFNLADIMGVKKLPSDTAEIAKFLDGRTWEE